MTPLTKRTADYPTHINPEKLPANTRFDPRGRGRWVYRIRTKGSRQKEIRIGDASATIAELWAAVDRIESGQEDTFRGMSLAFQQTDVWRELAPSTQRDYELCHRAVCDRETRAGAKLGDVPLEAWTPGAIRRYRDTRKKESPSRAAHDIRYIKRLFQWGIEYEHHPGPNPATGISLKGLSKPRDHYVQDNDYFSLLCVAPLRIALLSHLALLTGRRRQDLVRLKRSDIERDGIFFRESKTDKSSRVLWSDELRQLVELIKEEADTSVWLFPGAPGEHYRLAAMDTAWQRIKKSMLKVNAVPFQFKDLRAKHASDLDEMGGDATDNLLHSDAQVTRRHYLRKPKNVVSLR